jgi:hypothetical protein
MIRRIVPGIAVLGLVAGLSGTLAGHLWNRYSQTSELGFSAGESHVSRKLLAH